MLGQRILQRYVGQLVREPPRKLRRQPTVLLILRLDLLGGAAAVVDSSPAVHR